jgi:hypothetical protein
MTKPALADPILARFRAALARILYDTGAVINALPFSAGAYGARTPLMQELRRDGVDL